jgi:hypothetical protein
MNLDPVANIVLRVLASRNQDRSVPFKHTSRIIFQGYLISDVVQMQSETVVTLGEGHM